VPIVVAGATEEKPEMVARVNWSGLGVGLKKQRVTPAQIGPAIHQVLDDPAHRERARALQSELAAAGGPALSADLVEQLVATREPVLRGRYDAGASSGSPALAGVSS
jgi:UDP:flavonoid glycosyltransferase YjiC (YdhE family)